METALLVIVGCLIGGGVVFLLLRHALSTRYRLMASVAMAAITGIAGPAAVGAGLTATIPIAAVAGLTIVLLAGLELHEARTQRHAAEVEVLVQQTENFEEVFRRHFLGGERIQDVAKSLGVSGQCVTAMVDIITRILDLNDGAV